MKVTAITTTVRGWDFLLQQKQALEAQSLKDFEWIIKDDRRNERAFKIESDKFPVIYTPEGEGVVDYFAPALGQNTCLKYASGELVYFMNDYVLPLPHILSRHYWNIYHNYGPKVAIAGQMEPMNGQLRFPPRQGDFKFPDDVQECLCGHACWQFSFGRNDSAPLALLREVGGLDQSFDGDRGGSDVDLAMRLMMAGARIIIDEHLGALEYPHHGEKFPWDKKLPKKGYWDSIREGYWPKKAYVDNAVAQT